MFQFTKNSKRFGKKIDNVNRTLRSTYEYLPIKRNYSVYRLSLDGDN